MRNETNIKLKAFQNYFCDGLASALGEFLDVYNDYNEDEILKKINIDELKTLVEYSVLKNKIAGNERKQLAEFIVDVNGDRGPNRFGVDIFVFILTNDGIIPTGGNFIGPSTVWPYDFENGCLNSDSKGGGCTAWVLTHSNLDYLHCPDKIRAGKTSCKEK